MSAKPRPISRNFFARPVDDVARALIGVTLDVKGVGGIIVETESYDSGDPASHVFGGKRTLRNAAMFGSPATAYVYRSYGIHWCLNLVCGDASAVLIRALEPRHGLRAMRTRRDTDDLKKLCSGPGRLCQALGITDRLDGVSLLQRPFALSLGSETPEIQSGVRIGITKGVDAVRRFGLRDSPYLSRRFRDDAST